MGRNSWTNSASSSTTGKFGTLLRRLYPSFDQREKSSKLPRLFVLTFVLCTNIASRIHEHTEGGKGYACLNHVLNKLSFLPPRRRNINVFVTEQDVVSQRQRRYVEYLEIRVRGRGAATCSELDDIEDHYSQVEAELDRKQSFLNSTVSPIVADNRKASVRIRDDQSRSAEETASRARDAAKEERAVVVDGELDGMEKDGERIDETEEGTGQAKAKTT